jgi:hypothetical protein
MTTTKGEWFLEKFNNARNLVGPEIDWQMIFRSKEDWDRYIEYKKKVDEVTGEMISVYVGMYLTPHQFNVGQYLNEWDLFIDKEFPGFLVSNNMKSVMKTYAEAFIKVYLT